MSLIKIENLGYDLGAKKILHDIDLNILEGEIVTVVGPNGSGKSTLLRLIIGAITPTKGSIERKPNLRIGYVPQSLHIDSTIPITVRRFLNLPVRVPISDLTEATKQTGINNLFDKQMTELSGGQFQRVLLARALINKPRILLMDEIFAAVDPITIENIKKIIVNLQVNKNISILITDHAFDNVLQISDKIFIISDGKIVSSGKPQDIIRDENARQVYFGETY